MSVRNTNSFVYRAAGDAALYVAVVAALVLACRRRRTSQNVWPASELQHLCQPDEVRRREAEQPLPIEFPVVVD